MTRIVIIFNCLLFAKPGAADSVMRDFYIHIRKESIEVGEYEKRTLKPFAFKTYPVNEVNEDEIRRYFFIDGEENILYYVHCWMGNFDFYNKGALKQLESLNRIDKMIAVKWESRGVFYRSNWYNARHEGGKVASLFAHLLQTEKKNNILLCHSMGHSVFLGMAKNIHPANPYFKLIIFAGADLPADVLDNELKAIGYLGAQVIIYTHQKDRMLQISGWLHQRKRLGILPLADSLRYEQIKNLSIIDVTDWAGNRSLSPSNHVYFKDHDGVKKDMNKWIEKALTPG